MDSRFALASVAESAEEALESAQTSESGIIVLEHALAGTLTGLDAAQRAGYAKTNMFTAHPEHQALADERPAIDAFLLKTDSTRLLLLAQRLTGLAPPCWEHHVREFKHVVPGWPSPLRRRWFWRTALPRSGWPRWSRSPRRQTCARRP
jgi:hypothetical protein